MQVEIFGDFNFDLLSQPTFKEDSVREELINPLLYNLGYSASGFNQIIRSRTLTHPVLTVGSSQRKINIIPDYLLMVDNKPAWVLDAKSPNEKIDTGQHVQQAYSYAIHPEIRAKFYALCNGREFILFSIEDDKHILYFQLSEISKHWDKLYEQLSPNAFKNQPIYVTHKKQSVFEYGRVIPPRKIENIKKQGVARHFGAHPYFTRQAWKVVQEYIKHFSQPNDIILDPFGGSGVTAIESHILGRRSIHIDINPLSIFIVQNLVQPVDFNLLASEFERIKKIFAHSEPKTDEQIKTILAKYPYPKDISLPKDADVEFIQQLFTEKQLAQLALLKHLIQTINDDGVRGTVMLMFSGLLNKINLTYHTSSKQTIGQGDSGIFKYYRYRIAPKPIELDILHYFQSRYDKVVKAKKELKPYITSDNFSHMIIQKGTATRLHNIQNETIDYIYTDPPYGKKIQYLDLSIMWNAWLDLPVTDEDYEHEAIEGGKLNKSRDDYAHLLEDSIEEMFRVLKFDRWMSFVFAHKDPAYWHIIVETAEKAGFEYMGATSQSNDKISFKKNQNPYTVLSGQLIINFKKARNPRTIMKMNVGENIVALVIETIEGVIAHKNGATLEDINDELVMKGIEFGFLDILSQKYSDITSLLSQHFSYDETTQKYHIPQNTKFQSRIDVHLRILYFLKSYLIRMRQQNYDPTFDEIILHIMPFLKNGITPEEQSILSVLEEIAQQVGDGKWRYQENQQLSLF
jgi:DNA modification methylase